jgi:hypothetical protein
MSKRKTSSKDLIMYNVCAWKPDGTRVMKEMVDGHNPREAIDLGKLILRDRGFVPSRLRIEAVKLWPARLWPSRLPNIMSNAKPLGAAHGGKREGRDISKAARPR